jgi:hypothetical protein
VQGIFLEISRQKINICFESPIAFQTLLATTIAAVYWINIRSHLFTNSRRKRLSVDKLNGLAHSVAIKRGTVCNRRGGMENITNCQGYKSPIFT